MIDKVAKQPIWPVEIKEAKDSFNISMEIPGSARDDIRIWSENGLLIITGLKKAASGHRIYAERVYGQFSRSFLLPENTDIAEIEADYHDGVLTLVIPRPAEIKPKTIEIK